MYAEQTPALNPEPITLPTAPDVGAVSEQYARECFIHWTEELQDHLSEGNPVPIADSDFSVCYVDTDVSGTVPVRSFLELMNSDIVPSARPETALGAHDIAEHMPGYIRLLAKGTPADVARDAISWALKSPRDLDVGRVGDCLDAASNILTDCTLYDMGIPDMGDVGGNIPLGRRYLLALFRASQGDLDGAGELFEPDPSHIRIRAGEEVDRLVDDELANNESFRKLDQSIGWGQYTE